MKMGVRPLRLFKTTTFVKAMLPALLTLPLYVSKPPGTTGLTGQFWVIVISGVVVMGQVETTVLVAAPQTAKPMAVEMLVEEQLVGAS